MKKKVLIAAGGTGGHLFPAQQLAEMLQDDVELHFAGHELGTSPFFERKSIFFTEIASHPLKKGFFSAVLKGFWQACKLIRRFAPDIVIGFGSYHTFPLLLAAACFRKKIVLFEANSTLGKVNRFFKPFAAKVAFQFPTSLKNGVLVPWLPWKKEANRLSIAVAKKLYGLDPEKKVILVFGGSQGAAFLNKAAPEAIAKMREKCQAIHLAGPTDPEAVRSAYEKFGILACVKPFEKEMAHAYAAADFALCRSGAGTVAELIRFELPALLVPYPYATENHQKKNGEYLRDVLGASRLIDQEEAAVERIAEELDALIMEGEEKKLRLQEANAEDRQKVHLADVIRRIL
jgi:UDP-N-acetylglucosamine--N-acetylmuramyl-(pentapeptide) pyrophosphoryl-undecaprenol N-acetylglucosamine transferase